MAPLAPLAGPLILGGAGLYAASKMKPGSPKAPKIKPEDRAGMRAEAERKRRLLLANRRGAGSGTILGGEVGDKITGTVLGGTQQTGAGYG